jgi:hypothetical protein
MKRLLLGLLAGLASTLVLAQPAFAERQAPAQSKKPNPFVGIPANGAVTNLTSGIITPVKAIDVERFAEQDGRAVAVVALKDAAGKVITTASLPVQRIARSGSGYSAQAQGSCRILHLELGPLDLNLLGLRIQLSRVVLDITAQRGPGNLLGNLLCAVTGLLDPSAPTATLIARLNRLLGLLSGSPFSGVPATGTVTNGSTASQVGSIDVSRFAVQRGQLVALAAIRDTAGRVLANTAIPVDLSQTRVSSASFNGTQQSSCRILHLVLGPLDLNLLGLRIQLNRVVLDITAERGPGNLLGNLLCAVAGLLDPPGLTGLANRLNQIIGATGPSPFAGVPAAGTARRGRTVTQIGSATIRRFVGRGNRLVAVTALRDVAGRTIGTVRLPVRAAQGGTARFNQASCSILRLVLGPLDLNLLGLRVQLNRVVLNITAEPGAGNLLGNLLCGIVGLLDRTPLRAAPAAARLNRTLAFYR